MRTARRSEHLSVDQRTKLTPYRRAILALTQFWWWLCLIQDRWRGA